MSTISTITIAARSYNGDRDLPAIADLFNACEAVDRLDAGTSVPELRERMAQPNFDPFQNQRLWQTAAGEIVGMGSLWIPPEEGNLEGSWGFRVHPAYRQQGLEAEILAWAEHRLRQVRSAQGQILQLRAGSRDCQTDRQEFLAQYGFTIDREFYQMIRSLAEPIPTPQFPTGFTVRSVQGASDAADWVEMFNQSFIDHWNHHPYTIEQFLHNLTCQDYSADLDLVAIAPDGSLAAFCNGDICTADNQRTGRNEGWISSLGTRRGFRRLGLGRAMLLTGLHRLQATGVATAILGVDSQNPSGALHLYQSVGFQRRHASFAWVKSISG